MNDDPVAVVEWVRLVATPGSCRVCGDPAWSVDDEGFVHGCCAMYGKNPCPGCSASKALARAQADRKGFKRGG